MKLKNLLIGAALMIGIAANAQIKVGGSIGLQMPSGDFADAVKTGFGLSVDGKYFLNDKMAVGAQIGINSFSGKDDSKLKCSVIPVVGNFTYYFMEDQIKPFAGADLGFYKWAVKYDGEDVDDGMELGFGIYGGVAYELSDNMDLTGTLKYSSFDTEGDPIKYLGINVGVLIAF